MVIALYDWLNAEHQFFIFYFIFQNIKKNLFKILKLTLAQNITSEKIYFFFKIQYNIIIILHLNVLKNKC